MGIEPTTRVQRVTGFEDQGSHQAPFTSKTQGYTNDRGGDERYRFESSRPSRRDAPSKE